MKFNEYSDSELQKTALGILTQQLGTANTMRFLLFYQSRTEDYMEIQDQLFEGLSTQEVYEKAAEFWHSTTMRDANQTISVG